MTPTIATIVAAASKASQNHATRLAERQAAHAAVIAHRRSQAPSSALPAGAQATP